MAREQVIGAPALHSLHQYLGEGRLSTHVHVDLVSELLDLFPRLRRFSRQLGEAAQAGAGIQRLVRPAAQHGELAMDEELSFEPGGAVKAPEQHGDALRQRRLQRARRVEVGDHALPEPLERVGVLLRQHHGAGGRKAVAERVGRGRGLAGSVLGPVLKRQF